MAEKVTEIKFKLGGKLLSYDLQKELEIDKTKLSDALLDQSSKFAFVAVAYEGYKALSEGLKIDLDILEAELYSAAKTLAERSGQKITEGGVEAQIKTNSRWISKQSELQEARRTLGLLQAAKEAFQQRKDMLISLSSLYRAELDHDLDSLKSEYREKLKSKS